MNIKVRGCDAELSVEASKLVLKIDVPVKDEVEALKKMKEWQFVKADKPNLGSNKEAA
jgi:hypothetical protein